MGWGVGGWVGGGGVGGELSHTHTGISFKTPTPTPQLSGNDLKKSVYFWWHHATDTLTTSLVVFVWGHPLVTSASSHIWVSNEETWCSLRYYPRQVVEQRVELPVIWDALILMWLHCNSKVHGSNLVPNRVPIGPTLTPCTFQFADKYVPYFSKLGMIKIPDTGIIIFWIAAYQLPPQCLWPPLATLRWRHNGCDSVSNHQLHHCLLNRLFRRRSKKTSRLRVTGLCVGNSPGTGEFPAQMASNAENVFIWWRHHD